MVTTTRRRRKPAPLSAKDLDQAQEFVRYGSRHLDTVHAYLRRARGVVGDNAAAIFAVTKLYVRCDNRLEPKPEPGSQCTPVYWMLAVIQSRPCILRSYIKAWLQKEALP